MNIIHVDMYAFFASVEQRDNPDLNGKPVVVGGSPEQRGVVAAASYEARKYGVKSAMPTAKAKRICPGLILLPPNHAKYKVVSDCLMQIFRLYTPIVEPISLDEAFLDVNGCEKIFGSPKDIAVKIQQHIEKTLHLTASVGVGPNKFIAKLASGYKKPHGLTVVTQDKVLSFLAPLPVEKIWGTGDKTAHQLKRMGINTIGQLKNVSLHLLEHTFGKYGITLYNFARGEDSRPVNPHTEAKSVGKEITFGSDVYDLEELKHTLYVLAEKVGRRLRKESIKCTAVTLKMKYPNFQMVTRTQTLYEPTNLTGPIYKTAENLLEKHCRPPIRLIGLSCSKITRQNTNLLFPDDNIIKEEKITKAVDKLKDRYGEDIITVGSLLKRDPPIR